LFSILGKSKYDLKNLKRIAIEPYKIISNNIFLLMKDGKSLMVTSPSFIHKKPLITAKIALAMAELGKTILLVDLNVKGPALHQLFSLDNHYGLTSLLFEDEIKQSPISQTVYDNLHVLTAGTTDYLSKSIVWEKLGDMITEWGEIYDFLLFELPPYLGVSDTQILTEKGDGVLLVIEEGSTLKKELIETKNRLELGRKKFIGTIYSS
jgi:protein-tyrosine kinase